MSYSILVENSKTNNISHKSLKLRLYPSIEQKILIDKTFGCCRKLYNEHLQEKNEFYIENILPVKNKKNEKEKKEIYKTFKPRTEKEWKSVYPYLTEVSSTSLQQAR